MKELRFQIKRFEELHTEELYQLLRLRTEVFVVEQNCVYQDLDNKDQQALHVLGYTAGQLVAYTRCFDKNLYFEEASIGRVVVHPDYRHLKFGYRLMQKSIAVIQEEFHTTTIKISAQQYLIRFYEQLGFQTTGEGYLEDDIPHIAMIRQ